MNCQTLSVRNNSSFYFISNFIQQKCLILDEDILYAWSNIINSMIQMPYDAVKYKPKSENKSLSETTKLNDSTTTVLTSINTNEDEPELL